MILTRDGKEITAIYKQDGSEVEEVKDANGRFVYLASREITGTLPLYFSSRGKPLTDYLISGNTVQNGTPTPEAPVDAVGCGVRTGNLFDKSTTQNGYYIDDADGKMKYSIGYVGVLSASDYIDIANTSSIFIADTSRSRWGAYYDSSKTYVSGFIGYGSKSVPSTARYVRITVPNAELDSMMLNLGSTAMPCEPYGYKLPLTVNGTEYPIYLGQVETTRRVKKLVLTGNEIILRDREREGSWRFFTEKLISAKNSTGEICSHFENIGTNDVNNSDNIGFSIFNNAQFGCRCPKSIADTATGFKSYLAQQYAAGTPVTVWYALAEPETAIVNEPLMKIGDYADTISFAQAGVMIPTVSGTNVLDMTSTVKPSEVYIKGKGIKPTGYGQLVDKNGVRILDKNNVRILVHGQ